MRRKLLTICIFLIVAFVFASCSKINKSEDTEHRPVLSTTEEVKDESLSRHTDEAEKTVDLKETQKTEPSKDEKVQEKNETDEANNKEEKTETTEIENLQEENEDNKVNNTAVTNNSNENAETKKDVSECILSVRCDAVFENIDKLNKEKTAVLPQNGIIFPKTKVIFYDGESVFNVLTRELKKNRIHIDFVNTPMYNTVYIRGISNLYERDCGELSGWIYMVNDKVPSYGCSQYILKDGDKIEFVYTCDLGKDIN